MITGYFGRFALAAAMLMLVSTGVHAKSTIDGCLARKDCSFGVWGAAAAVTQMSFWVKTSTWNHFTDTDKASMVDALEKHLLAAKQHSDEYVTNKTYWARIGRSSRFYGQFVQNIATMSSWVIVLCDDKNEQGSLIMTKMYPKKHTSLSGFSSECWFAENDCTAGAADRPEKFSDRDAVRFSQLAKAPPRFDPAADSPREIGYRNSASGYRNPVGATSVAPTEFW